MLRSLLVLGALLAAGISAPATAGTLYAIDGTTNSLVTINRTTGAVTLVGSTGVSSGNFGDLAYDTNTATMYWTPGRGNNSIYTINVTTGAATLVGNTGLSELFGLTFDSVNNILYGRSNSDTNLYRISTATGAATAVNPVSCDNCALEFRADTNTLYGMSTNGPLYAIDRSSGVTTTLSSGASSVDNNDLAWNSELGAWWVVDWTRTIYRYNAAFTSRTVVATWTNALDGVVFVADPPVDTPEPASMAILGIGLLGLRLARRR